MFTACRLYMFDYISGRGVVPIETLDWEDWEYTLGRPFDYAAALKRMNRISGYWVVLCWG